MGWFFQIFAEIVLQMFGEMFADLLERKTQRFRRAREPAKPWLLILKYSVFGVVVGAISVLLIPRSFIVQEWLGYIHLAVMPFVAGWVMMKIGRWQQGRGNQVSGLENFMCGFAFAFCMGLFRFAWTQ
jgi:hypothetical protein